MSRTMIKRVAWVVGTLVVAGGLGVWGFMEASKRAWIHYNEYDIRSEGSLRVGDAAPDLALADADGSGTVQLSELFESKPLVLVFGSYT